MTGNAAKKDQQARCMGARPRITTTFALPARSLLPAATVRTLVPDRADHGRVAWESLYRLPGGAEVLVRVRERERLPWRPPRFSHFDLANRRHL